MWNTVMQRAAPAMAALARGGARFGSMANRMPDTNMLDFDPDKAAADPLAPKSSSGDLQKGWVPAMQARLKEIAANRDAAMAAKAAPPASFDERFGNWPKGLWSGLDGPPVSDGSPEASAARAVQPQGNPFPAPMGQPQGNPFPAPMGIQGMNNAVGNMADPAMSEAAGMNKARQVIDPATGQMMNDFYSKSMFPSFFSPYR